MVISSHTLLGDRGGMEFYVAKDKAVPYLPEFDPKCLR